MSKVGHNSIAVDQLKSIIQRVEKLEEEKSVIASDIKEVMAEAKGNGFDTKTIKAVIKLRSLDDQTREEQEAIMYAYMKALGMVHDA